VNRTARFLPVWLFVAYLILNKEIYSYAVIARKCYYGKFTRNNIVARIFVPACGCSRLKDGTFFSTITYIPSLIVRHRRHKQKKLINLVIQWPHCQAEF